MCQILIVEDDGVRRRRIKQLVRASAPTCDVIELSSKAAFDDWFRENHSVSIDLVIADLYLQGEPPDDKGEGDQVLRTVLEHQADCAGILLSSYAPIDALKTRMSNLRRRIYFVSFHDTSRSVWGQLQEYVDIELKTLANATANMR